MIISLTGFSIFLSKSRILIYPNLGIITYIPLFKILITYLPNPKFKLHISPSYCKMTQIPFQT
ncbi:hypothetical protein HanXRQr2_Chr10g0459421 [Helianthus annuus]|uniref:Uncharacterized protein n=1 Tax=Helianthus annuus TaxID=4232 RepID=A0A9K3I0J1_HELAN|nr:hypothetical protein HanXRQr2_Chr10g0459421 [Helianthus annuus]